MSKRLQATLGLLLLALLAVAMLAACGTPADGRPTTLHRPKVGPTNRTPPVMLRLKAIGDPTVGEVLTTTNGTWTNNPTGFSYQWQHCSGSCSNVGTNATTYTVAAGDVGDTIQVIVTASNGAGSASQTSAQTSVVTSGGGGGGSQVLNCFSSPLSCGYPDPAAAVGSAAHVGPNTDCSNLTPSGPITASTNGQTISNVNVTGGITVTAANVTINNVCVTHGAGGFAATTVIELQDSASNTLISNSTIQGTSNGLDGNGVEAAVQNNPNTGGATQTLSHDYLHWCGECIHDGGFVVNDSYVISDGMQGTTDHLEDAYFGNGGTDSFNHDTVLNPAAQTAVFFADDLAGQPGNCGGGLTVKSSLLAGGEMPFWTCFGNLNTWKLDVENNNFAGCNPSSGVFTQLSDGGTICGPNTGNYCGWACLPEAYNSDTSGYWPLTGYEWYTNVNWCPGSTGATAGQLTWSGNIQDDNGASVPCVNAFGAQNGSGHSNVFPDMYGAPGVAGPGTVGTADTVTSGSWTNNPTSFTYQWQDCSATLSCTNIPAATSSSYTPVSGDRGSYLRAVVTATNGSGTGTANAGIWPTPVS